MDKVYRLSQGDTLSSRARRIGATLTMLLVLALPGFAQATFVDFSGMVTGGGTGSVPEPFSVGDPLAGSIELEDEAALPGAMFDADDLLGFSFMVGSVAFELSDSTPFGFFDGVVSNDGTTLTEFNASTSFGPFAGCGTCNLTLNGAADSFAVSVTGLQNFGVAEGELASTVRAAAAVPEPPALWLLGLGLALMGLTATRRVRG